MSPRILRAPSRTDRCAENSRVTSRSVVATSTCRSTGPWCGDSPAACCERRRASRLARSRATARWRAMQGRPALPVRPATRLARTRSRSWCPATGSSMPMADSVAIPAALTASGTCLPWRDRFPPEARASRWSVARTRGGRGRGRGRGQTNTPSGTTTATRRPAIRPAVLGTVVVTDRTGDETQVGSRAGEGQAGPGEAVARGPRQRSCRLARLTAEDDHVPPSPTNELAPMNWFPSGRSVPISPTSCHDRPSVEAQPLADLAPNSAISVSAWRPMAKRPSHRR